MQHILQKKITLLEINIEHKVKANNFVERICLPLKSGTCVKTYILLKLYLSFSKCFSQPIANCILFFTNSTVELYF